MTIWRGKTISAFRFLPLSSEIGILKCSETTSIINSGVISLALSGEIISFSASAASGISIDLFSKFAIAINLFKEPSNSRMFDFILFAIYCMTSFGMWYLSNPSNSTFFCKIAILVS